MSRIPSSERLMDQNYNWRWVAIPAARRIAMGNAMAGRADVKAAEFEASADAWAAKGPKYADVAGRNLTDAASYRTEAVAIRAEVAEIVISQNPITESQE